MPKQYDIPYKGEPKNYLKTEFTHKGKVYHCFGQTNYPMDKVPQPILILILDNARPMAMKEFESRGYNFLEDFVAVLECVVMKESKP